MLKDALKSTNCQKMALEIERFGRKLDSQLSEQLMIHLPRDRIRPLASPAERLPLICQPQILLQPLK